VINIFAKESRLIVIFFLTVIILGSILVYLSISNISNYQELTEKKIMEEEGALAEQFSADFQSELEGLIVTFEDSMQKDSLLNIHVFKNMVAIPGIEQVIVMTENGAFLWPYFKDANSTPKKGNPSLAYIDKIKIAENNEFVVQDYRSAAANYVSALRAAGRPSDSAHVFNALSRLYVKMNQYESALNTYALILSDFSYTTNVSGFPYAYFSVNQLLKINDPSKNEEVQKLLTSFLSNLSDGTIPLNYTTSDLLARILVWTAQLEENENTLKMEALIQEVSDYLTLIDNYKDPITEIINAENSIKQGKPIDDFDILKPVSGIPEEVLLFNERMPNPLGFTIDLDELIDVVKGIQVQSQAKFKYRIELVSSDSWNNFTDSDLIYLSEFSPYFDGYRIKVELKNEHFVEEYVFKRKILYGIGFVLLLGVMALGLILLVQDVKRERRMERLRSDFVSNVTHELKTPLTAIQMFAESIFMGRAPSDTVLKKYSNIIVKESKNLQRMINNILEFSRKENDKLKYETQDASLSEIVNSTVDEMNYWMEINKFNVTLIIQPNIDAKVNSEGIKQALSNLISNAIKYSGEKKKLIIRLIKKETTALIEVEDFGIGIPKEKLELIFEKFYRVNSAENKTASGTGLGLTVTKDIIEAQNGKLLVQSTPGKGSKFTIVLNI